MDRCEDYPCCGHGPESTGGDGGGCPDSEGRFDCVLCGAKLPKGNHSSICNGCLNRRKELDDLDPTGQDLEAAFYDPEDLYYS